jgi:transcriptional regulator with XRE-family HTH domain
MGPAVATTYQDPAASKRRLLRELRRYRAQADLTQKDVADALDWSASKVVRIESGTVAVSTTDLRALLQTYRVDDADVVSDLTALAKDAKRQSSWADFRDAISQAAATYFGYEESASIIRQFEPLLIPGMLQTEEYARALLREAFDLSGSRIDRQVQVRARRQELLDRDHPPQMFFIVGEAALRQNVGGPAVMRRQLERLAEMAAQPNISVQVMGFDLEAHPGLRGPFVLLEFPDPGDDNVLYLESRVSWVTRDDTEETAGFLDAFLDMEAKATDRDDLSRVLFPPA